MVNCDINGIFINDQIALHVDQLNVTLESAQLKLVYNLCNNYCAHVSYTCALTYPRAANLSLSKLE